MKRDRYFIAKHTCIGASHIKQGKLCQDFSLCGSGKNHRYGVVSDGHGGEDYFRSDLGSRFAAEAFALCVSDTAFLRCFSRADGKRECETLVSQLLKSLILRWNNAVEAHLSEFPLTEAELSAVSDKAREKYLSSEHLTSVYGTTLVGFAAVGKHFFAVQIGDGKCVALKEGELFEPIPPDEDCFLNVTTSLSASNAYEKFRVFCTDEVPSGVFICTDGVSDSFSEENFLDFCRLALENLKESGEDGTAELFDYLPTLSEKGSGDDMSVCIMIDLELEDGQ